MQISAKCRYGLAAMVLAAQVYTSGDTLPLVRISEELGISKIYLEQVFSLLKRAELVHSTKGAQGGYRLSRPPEEITIKEIMSAIETSLFEPIEAGVERKAPHIDAALRTVVLERMDDALFALLSGITLAALAAEAEKNLSADALMFYI